jgi:putative ABC transport system permease protein
MTTLRDDLRFALRTLRKSPAFALTAITTIALGIGASTAIFSVVNAVLLQSLPYASPDELVLVQSDLAARNVNDFPLPPGDIPDMIRGTPAFSEVAAVVTNRQTFMTESGDPELVNTAGVTTNFFRTLRAQVMRGRDFVEADGAFIPPPPPPAEGQPAQPPPAPPPATVILSHEFWQRRFGGDPNVIGTTLRMGQQSAEIVGILQPGFELLWPKASEIEPHPDLYAAMRIDFTNGSRVNVFLRAVARLAPGATVAQAQDQVNRVVDELKKQFPVKGTAGLRWRVEPMHAYVVAGVKPALIALMGAVAFVLLIACANVANLLLVRASQRERELVVRSALGSRRWALLRQMLVESFAVAVAGGVLGLALAWAGTRLLVAFGPADLPRLDQVSIDPFVLGFALLATLAAAILFGLVPAIRASRVSVADVLRSSSRTGALSGAGRFMRNAVVVVEVALAFVLLVGSGLMIRSFVVLMRAEPGFDPNGVLTFEVPNQGRPSDDEGRALIQRIGERLRAIPSVSAVSAAAPLPLEGSASNVRWGTEAAIADPSLFQQADFRIVQPGYFEAMRTRLIEGRTFTEADNRLDSRLAVVDDVFARKAFPGVSAVGKRFLSRTGGPEPIWYEVIGVVQQQRNASLASESRETMYLSDGEFGFANANRWVVRTSGDPMQIAQQVRSELKQLDRTLVITGIRPLAELVDLTRAPTRFALACIGLFAVIAAVLASVGLYGVLSTAVRQRTAEIGVRMAFGASAGSIFGMVVRNGVTLSVIGIAAGVLSGLALTRLLGTMLVGVGATDPATFASIAALFLVLAILACWIPARRAAMLQPLDALRED